VHPPARSTLGGSAKVQEEAKARRYREKCMLFLRHRFEA
jgi:hypothetical protein